MSDSARKHKIPRAMFFIQLPSFSYSRFPPPTKGLKEQRLALAGLLGSLAREKISGQVRRLADTERSQLAEMTTGTQAPVSPRIYRFTNQSDATCFSCNHTRGRMRRLWSLRFMPRSEEDGRWQAEGASEGAHPHPPVAPPAYHQDGNQGALGTRSAQSRVPI